MIDAHIHLWDTCHLIHGQKADGIPASGPFEVRHAIQLLDPESSIHSS